jgi:hypothetical protein
MEDRDTMNIMDDKRDNNLKLEVLDYFPDDRPFSSLTYLQGIEKVCYPETETFIVELKGPHIKQKASKSSSKNHDYDLNSQLHNNKPLSLLNPNLQNEIVGRGLHRRWKDFHTQINIINSWDIFHFTLTEGTGQRRYLTSLIFFELWIDIRRKRAYLVPMIYSLVSNYPVFNFQKQCLLTIFNDCIKNLNMKLFNDVPKLFKYVVSDDSKLSYSYALVIKRLGFFLSLIFNCLRASSSGEVINIYRSVEKNKSLIKYENSFTSSKHFKVENFDFSILFNKIKINVLIQLYAAILLERKIIIVTNDVCNNAVIIETLQTLLYPMKWNLFSVAVITTETADFLDAPFPYILGMSQDTWTELKPYKWGCLAEETFVVDIETNKMYLKEPLPPLPPTLSGVLQTTLEQYLSKLDRNSMTNTRELEDFWVKTSLSIKQEFLYFLIFLMNDFVECYKNTYSKKGSDGGIELTWIEDIFRYEEYLKNIHKSSDFSPEFTSKFIHTQLFTQLIEHYYTPESSNANSMSTDFMAIQAADNRIICFKKLLREFERGGLRGLRNMQKSEINITLDWYFHSNDISIEEWYCYYTDLLVNRKENKTRDKHGIKYQDETPSTKNIRLLATIRKSDCVDMSDFYEEILGISTKEMTMSENVSIPEINKRRLCNVELLTNKRMRPEAKNLWMRSTELKLHFPIDEKASMSSARVNNNFYLANINDIWSNKKTTPKRNFSKPYRESCLTNKSIDFSNRYEGLSAEWVTRKDPKFGPSPLMVDKTFRDNQISYRKNVRQERLSAMKVIRSVCHRDQVESMFKGRSSIEEKEPKYFNYSKNDRENKYRKYANYADNWAGLDSSLDTPNKPKDNRSNTKPYKLPGEYISSFRYRSTSFQNSFSEPPSYYSKTGSSRETFSTQSKQKEEDINYAERALARKATRAKEFEKVYKESTEGGLKSPPIQEVAKRAYLKLDRQPQKEDRGTLAEQVRKYKDSQKINEYKNLETLNSDRGSGYLIEFT